MEEGRKTTTISFPKRLLPEIYTLEKDCKPKRVPGCLFYFNQKYKLIFFFYQEILTDPGNLATKKVIIALLCFFASSCKSITFL